VTPRPPLPPRRLACDQACGALIPNGPLSSHCTAVQPAGGPAATATPESLGTYAARAASERSAHATVARRRSVASALAALVSRALTTSAPPTRSPARRTPAAASALSRWASVTWCLKRTTRREPSGAAAAAAAAGVACAVLEQKLRPAVSTDAANSAWRGRGERWERRNGEEEFVTSAGDGEPVLPCFSACSRYLSLTRYAGGVAAHAGACAATLR
jgi:hypothetical protein